MIVYLIAQIKTERETKNMKKAYSIIINVERGRAGQEHAEEVYIKNILITDKNGAHNFEIKRYFANNSSVMACGFFYALNNGYKKPRFHGEFGLYWFDNIRIIETAGDLHNYPVRERELLEIFGFSMKDLEG